MIKVMIVTLSLSVAFDCQSKQFASLCNEGYWGYEL